MEEGDAPSREGRPLGGRWVTSGLLSWEDAGGDDDEQGLEMSERGINGEEEEGGGGLNFRAQIIMPRHTEQIDAVICARTRRRSPLPPGPI